MISAGRLVSHLTALVVAVVVAAAPAVMDAQSPEVKDDLGASAMTVEGTATDSNFRRFSVDVTTFIHRGP